MPTSPGIVATKNNPEYVPQKIWTPPASNGGKFANINRPTAGATHEKALPVDEHPLQLYSLATPNGVKVPLMLEELLALGHRGAECDAWLINIQEGDQFGSGFVAVNPNSKIPALLDRNGGAPIRVFESGAILLYLAEKFGALLPSAPAARAVCLSWLFWQMGSAPYLGGGFGHFYAYALSKMEYPIDRFAMEVKRELDVLNQQLAQHSCIAGDDYSIADIAIWPCYGAMVRGVLYEAAEFLQVRDYTHVVDWAERVAQRQSRHGWPRCQAPSTMSKFPRSPNAARFALSISSTRSISALKAATISPETASASLTLPLWFPSTFPR